MVAMVNPHAIGRSGNHSALNTPVIVRVVFCVIGAPLTLIFLASPLNLIPKFACPIISGIASHGLISGNLIMNFLMNSPSDNPSSVFPYPAPWLPLIEPVFPLLVQ